MDAGGIQAFNLRTLPLWRKGIILRIDHWSFKALVYLAIVYAAAELAWPYVSWPDWNTDLPVDPSDPNLSINAVSDILVLLVFVFEAAAKILGYGVVTKKKKNENDSDDATSIDKLKPDEEEAIHNIFNLFDVDRSGTMSEVELRLAFRGLGFAESSEKVHRIFQELDREGNNEIDFDQFKDFMAAYILRQPPPPAYFDLAANRIDFVILVVSIVVLPIQFFIPDARKLGDIARIIRLSRLWNLFESDRMRSMKDLIRTFSAALARSTHVFALIGSTILIYSTIGVDIFGDGQLNARCVVSKDNQLAAAAAESIARVGRASRPSTVGELMRPQRHCGWSDCGDGFECRCTAEDGHQGSPPGCSRIPVGQMGEWSGPDRPVTLAYGFLGFDNVLEGALTCFVGMTQAHASFVIIPCSRLEPCPAND